MQQRARTTRGFRHWTGKVLPVLAVALLAIGPAHSKDKDKKKKQREAEVAAQVERQSQAEQAGRMEVARVERPDDDGFTPGETPQLAGKKSKHAAPPVQNIREPSRAETRAASVSVERIIEEVERRYKAKVVRVDKKSSGGRQIYELRVLSDDRMRIVRVDAETGKEI